MINKLKINSPVYSVLKDKINNNSFPWYEGNTPTDYSPNITFLYHEIVTRDLHIINLLKTVTFMLIMIFHIKLV